ncbi:glutathione S-transferase [Carpediemonas membranifera]|uniref:Glutathione S-transferase n=1 Tax=Carpediemonas membranifera TaxID=201153 RepID=A0A8J6ASI4_9EUKA|nr:glutathione S-transferase [Carpediemonas membranifera]|eukprot:KAG9392953.1 glutathione S-transferase [Carpediemonas membranifera]
MLLGKALPSRKVREMSPFGDLPMIEAGSLRISGDLPIYRFLGTLLGYTGTTPQEQAEVNMWVDTTADLTREMWGADFMAAKEGGATDYTVAGKKTEFGIQYLEPKLRLLSARFEARAHPLYIVGDTLTLADISLFSALEAIDREVPLALASFPGLSEWRVRMEQRPRIAALNDSGRRY